MDRITLTRAIKDLPAGYRTIFLLHEVEGYEHQEIAKILDCSVGNSKSQLHKAKLRIREFLAEPGNRPVAVAAPDVTAGERNAPAATQDAAGSRLRSNGIRFELRPSNVGAPLVRQRDERFRTSAGARAHT